MASGPWPGQGSAPMDAGGARRDLVQVYCVQSRRGYEPCGDTAWWTGWLTP